MRLGAIVSEATYLELASISRFAELFGDSYKFSEDSSKLLTTIDAAKRILIESFPSNEARSCMI